MNEAGKLPIGTLIKKGNDGKIYKVIDVVIPASGAVLHKIVDAVTSQLVTPHVTIFEVIVINNRGLYKEVLEYKIDFQKKIVTKLNKEIKEFKLIKSNLEAYSSDEEELNEFINIFKSEKSKSLVKLIKMKEHIDFKKFLTEWVE